MQQLGYYGATSQMHFSKQIHANFKTCAICRKAISASPDAIRSHLKTHKELPVNVVVAISALLTNVKGCNKMVANLEEATRNTVLSFVEFSKQIDHR